jgi:hypothetical protein
MDDLILVQQVQKALRKLYQNIGDTMITGGVDNMDKYKYLLGQAHAYQYILQEISNLLNKKEQNDGQEQSGDDTIVPFGSGSTKD